MGILDQHCFLFVVVVVVFQINPSHVLHRNETAIVNKTRAQQSDYCKMLHKNVSTKRIEQYNTNVIQYVTCLLKLPKNQSGYFFAQRTIQIHQLRNVVPYLNSYCIYQKPNGKCEKIVTNSHIKQDTTRRMCN